MKAKVNKTKNDKAVQSTVNFKDLLTEQIFALCLYGEARSESDDGIEAVASVIKNRTKINLYETTIKDVILFTKQFSCFNRNDKQYSNLKAIAADFDKYLKTDADLAKCLEIARKFMGNAKLTIDATHYHATDVG